MESENEMEAPRLTTKERIFSALDTLKEELHSVRATVEKLRAEAKNPRQLLSLRAAAKRLGVDRQKVLGRLIRSGLIETVPVNGRLRISVHELDRLVREGFRTATRAPRTPAPKKTEANVGDRIRMLDF